MERTVQTLVFIILLLSLTHQETHAQDNEPTSDDYYSSASALHDSESSPSQVFPRYINLKDLEDYPYIVVKPKTPIEFSLYQDEDMTDIFKNLESDRVANLLQNRRKVPLFHRGYSKSKKEDTRRPKSLRIGATYRMRPSRVPISMARYHSTSGGPMNSRVTGKRWQQRMRNSIAAMFPFLRQPNFENPDYSYNNHFHGSYQQPYLYSDGRYLVQAVPEEEYASDGYPNRVPYNLMVGDLATSGSTALPQRVLPYAMMPIRGGMMTSSHTLMPQRYNIMPPHLAAAVPKHRPLFDGIGGLKGASLEMSNAFADFADSEEHGPEVGQRFGSVGISVNNFLQMMGLGSSNGFTMEDVGFGGEGRGAAMDSSSLDFYPGYGNQANLDDVEDFPIFHEDITEHFLRRMNLTEFLMNATAFGKMGNGTIEISISSKDEDKPLKDDVKNEKEDIPLKLEVTPLKHKKTPTDTAYAPAKPLDYMDMQQTTRTKLDSNYDSVESKPSVASNDQKIPMAIYQNFAQHSNLSQMVGNTDQPTYASAQVLLNHNTNLSKLLPSREVEQRWKPTSTFRVERPQKPPVSVLHASNTSDGVNLFLALMPISEQ